MRRTVRPLVLRLSRRRSKTIIAGRNSGGLSNIRSSRHGGSFFIPLSLLGHSCCSWNLAQAAPVIGSPSTSKECSPSPPMLSPATRTDVSRGSEECRISDCEFNAMRARRSGHRRCQVPSGYSDDMQLPKQANRVALPSSILNKSRSPQRVSCLDDSDQRQASE